MTSLTSSFLHSLKFRVAPFYYTVNCPHGKLTATSTSDLFISFSLLLVIGSRSAITCTQRRSAQPMPREQVPVSIELEPEQRSCLRQPNWRHTNPCGPVPPDPERPPHQPSALRPRPNRPQNTACVSLLYQIPPTRVTDHPPTPTPTPTRISHPRADLTSTVVALPPPSPPLHPPTSPLPSPPVPIAASRVSRSPWRAYRPRTT